MFRIPLFPSSRFGRIAYMVGAILLAFTFLGAAWRDTKAERAFASHGAIADVLPPDHYTQHSERNKTTNVSHDTYKTADLSFLNAQGQRYTRNVRLEESEFETLKNGGTLHMQYLPEDPQGSARLERHATTSWIGYLLGVLFGLYAFALKP